MDATTKKLKIFLIVFLSIFVIGIATVIVFEEIINSAKETKKLEEASKIEYVSDTIVNDTIQIVEEQK